MFDNASIAIMYAVTPCHAGSGSALGVVDLPIQRERHTNWPMIQASGVKGAFRANFDRFKDKIDDKNQLNDFVQLTKSIFGTDSFEQKDKTEKLSFAGSCSISDAKILAYPMRSNVSPFVWITCPSVLKRFARDLEIAGMKTLFDTNKFSANDDEAVWLINIANCNNDEVLLEDFEVKINKNVQITNEINKLMEYLKRSKDGNKNGDEILTERLLLVSDEVFNYGVTDCTQIMAQIKIEAETGTTKEGSLRYQEELPSDTIMYTVIHWGDSKNSVEKLGADTIKRFITEDVIKSHIQIAGDETCGRGIFQLTWLPKNKE